jgi:hypothetical protein
MTPYDPLVGALREQVYRWGLQQWEHHIQTNFSEIRALRSSLAIAAAEALALFDADQKRRLAGALIERFRAGWQRGSPAMDVPSSELLARFDVERGTRVQSLAELATFSTKGLFTKRLKSRLKELLPPIVGELSGPSLVLGAGRRCSVTGRWLP